MSRSDRRTGAPQESPRRDIAGSHTTPESQGPVESLVDEEFAFHVEMRARELEEAGMAPETARRAAERAFGDPAAARAECVGLQESIRTRQRLRRVVGGLWGDVRIAGRGLARKPAFALLAVATLGLGIGSVTAMFSLVDATLLRPLPYPASDRIVHVWETHPAQPIRSVAPANFLDWQSRARTIDVWSAFRRAERTLALDGRVERVATASVTERFFETMGVTPQLGVGFSGRDAEGTAAVLSHSLWQSEFGSDAAVLGQIVRLDDIPYEIVGVAAEGFDFPAGTRLWTSADPDLPEARGFPGTPLDLRQLRDARFISVIGRMDEGVDLPRAQVEMHRLASDLRAEYPADNLDAGAVVVGLQDHLVAGFRGTVLLLFGAVALVLVIACANVANLLLVRALERRHELSLRAALGAGAGRILRMHLAEGLVLGAAGAAAGTLLALMLVRAASGWSWLWGDVALRLDARVALVVLAAAGLTTVVFGVLPSLLVRWAPTRVFSGRGVAGGIDPRAGRTRQALLALEVALAFGLVLSTGLTVRTVLNLRAVDLGFDTERVATMRILLPAEPESIEAREAALTEIVRQLEAEPSVDAVAVAGSGPLSTGPWAGLRVEGRTFGPGEAPDVGWQFVSPDYFDALGIPVTQGRAFTPLDGIEGEPVGIINQALAQRVFADQDPVGNRINTGLDGEGTWVRVVGVAYDTRNQGPAESAFPALYRPMHQAARRPARVIARLLGTPDAGALANLETVVRSAAPTAPVSSVMSGSAWTGQFTTGVRTSMIVLGSLAGLALLLSAIGLYGVTSYSVSRRTRDIGVRLALGARTPTIVRMVVDDTLRPCLVGLAVGLLASVGAGWVLRRLLFSVEPYDLLTIGLVAGLILTVAVAASVGPALRASSVDPASTLRE